MKTRILSILCLSICLFNPIYSFASNTQKVVIKGVVVNMATNGAKVKTNIGSTVGMRKPIKSNQVVSVSGAIINVASGWGTKSEINIGSVSR